MFFKRKPKPQIEYVEVKSSEFKDYKIPILGGTVEFVVKYCAVYQFSGIKITFGAMVYTAERETKEYWQKRLIDEGFEETRYNDEYFEKEVEVTDFSEMIARLKQEEIND